MAAGVFRLLMPRVAWALLTLALVVALLADPTRADARSRAPQLTGVRCVPASAGGRRAPPGPPAPGGGVRARVGGRLPRGREGEDRRPGAAARHPPGHGHARH